MEIEVKKVKLSKSILMQIYHISNSEIEGAECLGYLHNVLKPYYKLYLLRLPNSEYRLMAHGYRKFSGRTSLDLKTQKGTSTKYFNCQEDADKFLEFHDLLNLTAQQIFI